MIAYMYIEQLIYNIPPILQSKFLELDEAIWTAYLSKFEFYVSKEIWLDPTNLDYVSIVIHWRSLNEWKSIPSDDLNRLSQQFDKLSLEQCGQTFVIKDSNTFKTNKTT